MKIFFVGMHNKPNKTPLDSSTMTGKVIDEIINGLGNTCIKTNLCDVDYFLKDKAEIFKQASQWHKTNKPGEGDIIVLLGRWVKENFLRNNVSIITLPHPAGMFGPNNKAEYIKASIIKINSRVLTNSNK